MGISIIVAMTRDGVIGDKGGTPWHLREEIGHFKELTVGNTVVMGKNTWFSIPERSRPLSDRVNIIVSTTLLKQNGAIVCSTVKDAIATAESINKGETFCIGGEQLYKAMLPFADVMHISWIKKRYGGDAHFPKVDFSQWILTKRVDHSDFVYEKYLRQSPPD